MGNPSLDLAYEGFLETTTLDSQVPQIEHNMTHYSFYPKIGLSAIIQLNAK
jgi:hypothetical protein